MTDGEIPGNLKGYRLEKTGGGFLGKLILLIIIVLVVLWFVRREIVLDLWDYISGFLK